MGRIYARREDTGQYILIEIECDRCDAKIKPRPDINESGWMKDGVYIQPGDYTTRYWCPDCWESNDGIT